MIYQHPETCHLLVTVFRSSGTEKDSWAIVHSCDRQTSTNNEPLMTTEARSLQSLYLDIVNEMDRIAAPTASYDDLFAGSLPRLIATSSGASLQVTEGLDDLITEVAACLYDNSGRTETHSAEEYRKIVRSAFGDPLVQLNWDQENVKLAIELKEAVGVRVLNSFEASVRDYAFSCSLFDEGAFEPFSIGPATFSSRRSWLDRSEQHGLIDAETAKRARQRLDGVELEVLTGADDLYEKDLYELVLRPRRNVCSVEVHSLGQTTREKRAVETANLAISVLSLFVQSASLFHRSTFLAYDTSPHLKKVMSFTRGRKILPGSTLSHHPAPPLDVEQFSTLLHENRSELEVAGEALRYGVIPDNRVRRLQVSRAIRTSLTWFRRGCVDNDDRIAIVFFSAALDTLSPKGKNKGITELVCQTFGKGQAENIWDGGPQIHNLVKEIYDSGRSRLIHGTSDATNKDWSLLRIYAEQIAKLCLLGALIFFAKNPNCDELGALSRPANSP